MPRIRSFDGGALSEFVAKRLPWSGVELYAVGNAPPGVAIGERRAMTLVPLVF